jgi:hypothetical protein
MFLKGTMLFAAGHAAGKIYRDFLGRRIHAGKDEIGSHTYWLRSE